MRTCLIVLAAGLSVLAVAPAQAGRTGDLCVQTVNQTLGRYFDSEEQVSAAATAGGDALCLLLMEQVDILDLVVKTIEACPSTEENRGLRPAVEALREEKRASHAMQNCPEPAVPNPQ